MTQRANDRPSEPLPASASTSRSHILARRATFVSAALAGVGLVGASGACVCLSVEPVGDRQDAGAPAPDAGTPATTSTATATAPGTSTGTAPGTASAIVGEPDAGTPVPTASTTSTATPPRPPPRVCLSVPMPKPPKQM
ncbi:MAG: hypothetical protein IT373_35590 [Polyangiaceae bacterium]|nr:hypothetical protein [Polyangiaceae bacterium]